MGVLHLCVLLGTVIISDDLILPTRLHPDGYLIASWLLLEFN